MDLQEMDIVQITNDKHHWFPALVIVDEIKSFGCQGYIIMVTSNDPKIPNNPAYIRLNSEDFEKYLKDRRSAKKLADEYHYFVAQANIMSKVAAAFGKVFGPKKKMPNPKAGQIVPPKANLEPITNNLRKKVRIQNKKAPV